MTTDRTEYLHGAQNVYITIRNGTHRGIHLPNDAPWVVRRVPGGKIVAAGVPRKDRPGPRVVPPGLNAMWVWDQKTIGGTSFVDPGVYETEVQTRNNDMLRDSFSIVTPRPWTKRLAAHGRDASQNLGASVSAAGYVTAFTGPVSWVAVGVGQAACLALGWYLDSYSTDPQQPDFTRPVELREIQLGLPEAKTVLDSQSGNFARSVARVAVILRALQSAIDSYDAAEAAGEQGRAARAMHRAEIEKFSKGLAERLEALIGALDEWSRAMISSNLPLSISSSRLTQFQEQTRRQGLIKQEIDEAALLRQFGLSAADIENIIQRLTSSAPESGVQFSIEYEALRSALAEMVDGAKALPLDFQAR